MKKNKIFRLASVMLMLCLITTCAISVTFAKYTTSGTASDTARVAKWGVTVDVSGDDAFSTSYGTAVVSSTTDKVVAPGTNGTLATVSVSGQPEVAVNLEVHADLELTDWSIAEGNGTVEYCPIEFTVGNETVRMNPDNMSVASLEEALEKAVLKALLGIEPTDTDTTDIGFTSSTTKAANTSLDKSVSVAWNWAFENSDTSKVNTDARDTALGNLDTPPEISFSIEVSVTQIDE